MANSYSGLFQTLAASFHEASLAKVGKNILMTRVVNDFSPEVSTPFSVINTNIAASTGTPTNLASGSSLTLSDVTVNAGPVTLDQHPTYGFMLPSFDLAKGPSGSLVAKLRDEAIKRIGDYVNGVIAAKITTGNFNSYTVVSTGVDNDITDAKMSEAWQYLAGGDVPVGDLGNFYLSVHPAVYGNLLQRATWTQSAYIGDNKAGEIRATARLGAQWGAIADFDPDMPVTTGLYTCLLHHKYAMAMVARSLAPPMNPSIPCTYVSYKGIPIRVIVDFSQTLQADVITFDALFGVAVTRPDHGSVIVTS